MTYKELNPQKIIYSGDCTIVFWYDGTKTIVRKSKGTKDDKHSAFCAALAKKVFNTNSNLKRKIKTAENNKKKIKQIHSKKGSMFFDDGISVDSVRKKLDAFSEGNDYSFW